MSNCLSTDVLCLCTNAAYINAVFNCIAATCDSADQLTSHEYSIYFCGLYGVTTLPAGVTASYIGKSTSILPTVTVTESATVTASATSVGGITSPSIETAATTTKGQPAPTVTVTKNGSNIGEVVGGVIGGVVVLAIIFGALLYFYKHRGSNGEASTEALGKDKGKNQSGDMDMEKHGEQITSNLEPVIVETGNNQRDRILASGRLEQNSRIERQPDPPDTRNNQPIQHGDIPSGRLQYPDLSG